MRALAEQIAVLDGIDASSIDMDDGRIGQTPALTTQYARQIMPDVLARRNVIDPSTGANFSGGSSYAPGLPLMPSAIGLAGFGNIPGVLPMKRHVIDPSGGANYSGGSAYAPGVPLLASTVGLAAANEALIAGGYGAPGLGAAANAPLLAGGYGAAGFGNSGGSYVDQDLAGAFNGFESLRALDPNDGRIGQTPASQTQYAKMIMPDVLQRLNVIDASGGANYGGGSSYAPGLPLMPSTVGLAGLDRLGDNVFLRKIAPRARAAFKKVASKDKVSRLFSKMNSLRKAAMGSPNPMVRARAARDFANTAAMLTRVRTVRKAILEKNMINGVPVTAFAPVSPANLGNVMLTRDIIDGVRVSAASPYSPTTLYK